MGGGDVAGEDKRFGGGCGCGCGAVKVVFMVVGRGEGVRVVDWSQEKGVGV